MKNRCTQNVKVWVLVAGVTLLAVPQAIALDADALPQLPMLDKTVELAEEVVNEPETSVGSAAPVEPSDNSDLPASEVAAPATDSEPPSAGDASDLLVPAQIGPPAPEDGCRPETDGQRIVVHDGTKIGCTLFLPDVASAEHPVPVVMAGHSSLSTRVKDENSRDLFGASVWAQVKQWLDEGYAVLTWDSRGWGESGGYLSPGQLEAEGFDGRDLIDYLAAQPEILLDGPGDPRVAIVGEPWQGGQAAFVIGSVDDRVEAVVGDVAFWDLERFIRPNGVAAETEQVFICGAIAGAAEVDGLPYGEAGGWHPDIVNACIESMTVDELSDRTRAMFERYYLGRGINGAVLEDGSVAPGLTMPAMVLHGTLDYQAAAKHMRLYEAITGPDAVGPRSQHRLVIYDGHLFTRVKSLDVGDKVASFVRRHLTGDGSASTGPKIQWQQLRAYAAGQGAQIPRGGWEGRNALPRTQVVKVEDTVSLVHGPAATADDYNGAVDECARNAAAQDIDRGCVEKWLEVDDLPAQALVFGDGRVHAVIRSAAPEVRLFVKLIAFNPNDGSAHLLNWQSTPVRTAAGDASEVRVVEVPIDHTLHKMEPGEVLYVGVAGSSNYFRNSKYPGVSEIDLTVEFAIERTSSAAGSGSRQAPGPGSGSGRPGSDSGSGSGAGSVGDDVSAGGELPALGSQASSDGDQASAGADGTAVLSVDAAQRGRLPRGGVGVFALAVQGLLLMMLGAPLAGWKRSSGNGAARHASAGLGR